MHFPEQPIDWEYLLDEFVNPTHGFYNDRVLFQEQMRFFLYVWHVITCGSPSLQSLV
jgi:hypothetical protein